MIDPNILKSLESSFEDPSYSVVISHFDQPSFCNKGKVEISLQQFSPNLEKIIENKENYIEELKKILRDNNIEIPISDDENSPFYELNINNCIHKKLNIESFLDYDEEHLFISGLTGSIEDYMDKTNRRLLEGEIKHKRTYILTPDIPNYFNRTRFRIKTSTLMQTQLIIKIPKKIKEFLFKLRNKDDPEDEQYYSERDVFNDLLIIDIDPNKKYFFSIKYEIKNSLILQKIESISTQLKQNIELEFSYKYINIPAIIPTIDEDDKVYSDYSIKFIRTENYYSGAIITFEDIKKQKEYGDINITIIGESVEENTTEEENNTENEVTEDDENAASN